MDEDAANEVQVESGEGYISPLGVMAIEAHELYLELRKAGFPDSIIAQITAHMLSDAILYREEQEADEFDDDEDDFYIDDDDDEDGLENGSDS